PCTTDIYIRPLRAALPISIAANFLIGVALIVAMVDVPVVVALLAEEDRISELSAAYLAPFTLTMAILAFSGGALAARRGESQTADRKSTRLNSSHVKTSYA